MVVWPTKVLIYDDLCIYIYITYNYVYIYNQQMIELGLFLVYPIQSQLCGSPGEPGYWSYFYQYIKHVTMLVCGKILVSNFGPQSIPWCIILPMEKAIKKGDIVLRQTFFHGWLDWFPIDVWTMEMGLMYNGLFRSQSNQCPSTLLHFWCFSAISSHQTVIHGKIPEIHDFDSCHLWRVTFGEIAITMLNYYVSPKHS